MCDFELLNFVIGCIVAFFTTVNYYKRIDNIGNGDPFYDIEPRNVIEVAVIFAAYYIIIYHWLPWLIFFTLWKIDKKINNK